MEATQTFKEFLASQTPHVDLGSFALNLALCAVLLILLAVTYVRCGSSLSSRKAFSRNLVIVGLTTMLIITIVKSSLALSLGLVGALSIVRFRTPIKEPEELAYLFLSIAVGLGLGAGQRSVVMAGFAFIVAAIWIAHRRRESLEEYGMHLMVSSTDPSPDLLDRVVQTLERCASAVRLRRVDESADSFQGDFSISFDHYAQLNEAKQSLRSIDANLQISFLDGRMA